MADMYNRQDFTDESLEEYNARKNPNCELRESWYYDMIESLNAEAVSGGEWELSWRD